MKGSEGSHLSHPFTFSLPARANPSEQPVSKPMRTPDDDERSSRAVRGDAGAAPSGPWGSSCQGPGETTTGSESPARCWSRSWGWRDGCSPASGSKRTSPLSSSECAESQARLARRLISTSGGIERWALTLCAGESHMVLKQSGPSRGWIRSFAHAVVLWVALLGTLSCGSSSPAQPRCFQRAVALSCPGPTVSGAPSIHAIIVMTAGLEDCPAFWSDPVSVEFTIADPSAGYTWADLFLYDGVGTSVQSMSPSSGPATTTGHVSVTIQKHSSPCASSSSGCRETGAFGLAIVSASNQVVATCSGSLYWRGAK